MANGQTRNGICQVCGKSKPKSQLVPASVVRNTVADGIRREHPDWSGDGFICRADLNRYRSRYIQSLLEQEKGQLTTLEQEVAESLIQHEILSRNIESEFEKRATLGEHLSDKLSEFGGSWAFLIAFGVFMLVWMGINSILLVRHPFDPYPYILLNLVLSCLAAIQAPVIMMSQNRQEAKDRMRSKHDYQINMKAELEIRQLHEKMDFLLSSQWQRLLEIQQVQLELMDEVTTHRRR